MANMLESYDSAFLGVLQHEGNISSFLDVVFGFLYRRTDFYRIMHSKEDKMGFRPGVAFKLTAQAFQKYADQAAKDDELRNKLLNLENVHHDQQEDANEVQDLRSELESQLEPNSYGHYCLCLPRTDETLQDIYDVFGAYGDVTLATENDRCSYVFLAEKEAAIRACIDHRHATLLRAVRERLEPQDRAATKSDLAEPVIVGGNRADKGMQETFERAQSESSTETRSEKSEEAKKQIHLVCENFPYKTHFKDLYKAFRPLGKVKVNILNNTPPKQTYALVSFNDEAAVAAALTFDGEIFNGQMMSIRRCDPRLPKDKSYLMIANEDKATRIHNNSRVPSWAPSSSAPAEMFRPPLPPPFRPPPSAFGPMRGMARGRGGAPGFRPFGRPMDSRYGGGGFGETPPHEHHFRHKYYPY